jgi:hypothetical protein
MDILWSRRYQDIEDLSVTAGMLPHSYVLHMHKNKDTDTYLHTSAENDMHTWSHTLHKQIHATCKHDDP